MNRSSCGWDAFIWRPTPELFGWFRSNKSQAFDFVETAELVISSRSTFLSLPELVSIFFFCSLKYCSTAYSHNGSARQILSTASRPCDCASSCDYDKPMPSWLCAAYLAPMPVDDCSQTDCGYFTDLAGQIDIGNVPESTKRSQIRPIDCRARSLF